MKKFTITVEKGEKFMIASCKEIPQANGQGLTKDEALKDIQASIESVLDYRREEESVHESASKLIRHLVFEGCYCVNERGPHEIWKNPKTGETQAVPRHVGIDDKLAKRICRALSITEPPSA